MQRALKFAKYLPSFGVEPIIITVDPEKATYPATDHSLLAEARDVKVHTTDSFEALQIFARFAGKKRIPHSGFANVHKETFFKKTIRFIRGNFFIPDARIGWVNYAFRKACEVIEKEKIDAYLISSPPHSSQLVGLRLKKKYPNLKWIADLRDPWTDIYYYSKLMHTRWAASKDARLEKEVLTKADQLIVVSDQIKELFCSKIPTEDQQRFNVIPNGYDETDFVSSVKVASDVFTITYVGTMAESYRPDVFFKALLRILNQKKSVPVKFKLIGTLPDTLLLQTKLISDLFPDALEFLPYVEHDKAIHFMKEAHLLLLIIPDVPNSEGILTGKLFEYLGAERPILGIGPKNGAAAAIIEECKAGALFSRNEEEGVFSFIESSIKNWIEKREQFVSGDERKKYSRKSLTGRLAKII